MSEEGESRRGGASIRIMFWRGMRAMRYCMISDSNCLTLSGVRRCLFLVCLASFVITFSITVSLFLNVVCLILINVWGSVNVS